MQITKLLCDIFTSFLQIFSIYIFYNIFGDKRDLNKRIILLISILFILFTALATYFIKIQIVFIIVILLLFFGYSYIYKIPIIKRILIVLLINIVSSLLEVIFGLIMSVIYTVSIEDIQNNMALYIQAILISKLSFIAVSKILTHLIKRGNEKIKWWLICALCVIPISTFVVIYTLSSFAFNNNDNKTQILAIVSSVVLIISNLFAFYLFDYINKQSYKESKLEFETILFDNERQYYKDLLDNEHISNKTIHDLKNELFAIRALLEKNPSSAYEEINKICEIVDKNKIIKISTSDAVNSLTTAKVNIAKSKGINVDIESFVGNLKNINPVDFCMILGNLFDNAIEACEPVDINKNIYLELKSMDECISITMKNSTINKNVEIGKTTKVNKNKHGFGLNNIKEVLKEYNGIMRHEIIDDYFMINIIMQSGENL